MKYLLYKDSGSGTKTELQSKHKTVEDAMCAATNLDSEWDNLQPDLWVAFGPRPDCHVWSIELEVPDGD